MTTGLRRIFVTALLGALVGLGLVAVLFGRRPRTGAAAEIAAPPAAPSPVLPPSRPSTPVLPSPARTQSGGRHALAAGLAGLLLLAGGIFASRDLLFGPKTSAPDGGRPLTALSPPEAGLVDAPAPRAEAPVAGSAQPDRPAAGGSDSFTPPEGRGRPDAGAATVSPPQPRMDADATAPGGRSETSDPAKTQAGATPDRTNGPLSSAQLAETPRPPGRPMADAAEPFAKIVGGEAAEVGHLTGRASPGTGLRLVLNAPRIAPAIVGRDGSLTFGAGQGLRPGADAVRLDAAAGRRRERAGIPLSVPVPRDGDVAERRERPSEPDDRQPFSTGSVSTGALPRTGAGAGAVRGSGSGSGSGITTILVTRGDTLWSISRRTYGKGRRYTLIHDANPDQVRDPNRIRPGQILVLPRRATKRG